MDHFTNIKAQFTVKTFENIIKYIGDSLYNLNAHNLPQLNVGAWEILFAGCTRYIYLIRFRNRRRRYRREKVS
jgi:hypothetical protein